MARADELNRDGEPGKAYELFCEALKEAERLARQGIPGAKEFLAHCQCVFTGHTGDCNTSFARWPEEWTTEIMGRIKGFRSEG
ncbi:MAG: hypothetical protein ACR2HB_15830 [Dehalococcoidia bacterium]